jgi:hypothetical protein
MSMHMRMRIHMHMHILMHMHMRIRAGLSRLVVTCQWSAPPPSQDSQSTSRRYC